MLGSQPNGELGVRTLILDDDPVYLAVADGVLRSLGIHDVTLKQDGTEAVGTIARADPPFELVLLDLNMPGIDGLSFLRALAEINFGGSLIVVSGEKRAILSSAEHIAAKHGLNIVGALSKPMQLGEMRDALERVRGNETSRRSDVKVQHTGSAAQLSPMLHYQPQVAVGTRSIVGAEALLRCVTKDGLIIGPEPLLKAHSAPHDQLELTKSLFAILCRDIAALKNSISWTNTVSFNAGARVFEMDDLTRMLRDILAEHGVEATDITIELTEAELPRDPTRLLEVIARLGIAGFELSLDDFGTGASNFELLREGAFSEVKLDRSFIHAAVQGEEMSRKFLSITAEIAHSLDIRMIAEGIETEEDMRCMEEFGVEIVQGYLFGRPASLDDFILNARRTETRARQAS